MSDEIVSERAKYMQAWAWPGYRRQADGDAVVELAFQRMGCAPGDTIIDWGCGTGRPALKLQALGLRVTCFDIAPNCLDADIALPLVVGCLWSPPRGLEADYGFCTDVLEHLPTERVPAALAAIKARSRAAAFLQVDTAADICGAKLNPPQVLHLTVQPREWWEAEIGKQWRRVEALPGTYSRWAFICRE